MNIGIIGSGNMGQHGQDLGGKEPKGLVQLLQRSGEAAGSCRRRRSQCPHRHTRRGRGFRRADPSFRPMDSRSRSAEGGGELRGEGPVQLRQLPEAGLQRAGGRYQHVRRRRRS